MPGWTFRTAADYKTTSREVLTCSLHACLVLDAVQDVGLAILILLFEDQGCDLNQKAGQLGLHGSRSAAEPCLSVYQQCAGVKLSQGASTQPWL